MVKTYRLVPVDDQGKEMQAGIGQEDFVLYNDNLNGARLVKVKGEITSADLQRLSSNLQSFFPKNKFILLQESDSRRFEYFRVEEVKDKRPGFNLGKFRIRFGDDPKDANKEMDK